MSAMPLIMPNTKQRQILRLEPHNFFGKKCEICPQEGTRGHKVIRVRIYLFENATVQKVLHSYMN